MMACIFCQITQGQTGSDCVYEDERCMVINDLYPKAPVHQLIIPKKHIDSMADVQAEDEALMGHMMLVAKDMADKAGIAGKGYRLSVNCGEHGGQEVFHWHMHLLGGEKLR